MDPVFLRTLKWEDRYQRLQKFFQHIGQQNLWIALINNKIIGFCTACPCRFFDDNNGEISAIYVLNKFQNQGIGKILFEKAKNFLQDCGFNQFYIRVLKRNTKAQLFYTKQGGILFEAPPYTPDRFFPSTGPDHKLEEEFYRFTIHP